jgi:hypothetical protein
MLAGMRMAACFLVVAVAACKFPELPPVGDDGGGDDDDGGGGDDGGGPPTVASSMPADAATGVDPDGTIRVVFSRPMAAATIDDASFAVRRGGTEVEGSVTYDAGSRTATFAPAVRLALLGSYEATIAATVTDEDGTPLAAAHTWDFAVRDGAWGAEAPLETGTGDSGSVRGAVSKSGRAVAVWGQIGGASLYDGWANTFTPGAGWSSATVIDLFDEQGASVPGVVLDDAGDGWAVLPQVNGNTVYPYARRYENGAWGTTTMIGPSGGAAHLQLGLAGGGVAIATWINGGGITTNRYTPGTGWGTHAPFSAGSGNIAEMGAGVDDTGNVLVAWIQHDGARNSAYWNRYTPGSGWGTKTLLEADDSNAAVGVQLAVERDGTALVVFGLGTTYQARRFDGTTWGTTVPLGARNSPGETAAGSSLAVRDGVGLFVFADIADGGPMDMVYRRFTVAGGWTAAVALETNESGPTDYPWVAIDAAGNAVAVWRHYNGGRPDVWAARYAAGSGWGTAAPIETDQVNPVRWPHVSVGTQGEAVVTWGAGQNNAISVAAATFR